jgi:hypothetical protein
MALLLLLCSSTAAAFVSFTTVTCPDDARAWRVAASLLPDNEDAGIADRAAQLAADLRQSVEEAEDELRVEVEHSKKFLMRGKGLRHDVTHSHASRRRALIRGAFENEKALWNAMEQAELAGLPREYIEDALRTANALALSRAEIEADHLRLEDGERGGTISE